MYINSVYKPHTISDLAHNLVHLKTFFAYPFDINDLALHSSSKVNHTIAPRQMFHHG